MSSVSQASSSISQASSSISQASSSIESGRTEGLAVAYERYAGAVAGVVFMVVQDHSVVDQLVLDTFLTAKESGSSFGMSRTLAPWLFSLSRKVGLEHVSSSASTVVEVELGYSWELWELRLAMDELKSRDLAVLRFEHLDGLSHGEIATQLNLSIGAVKSCSYNAHRQLVRTAETLIEANGADGNLEIMLLDDAEHDGTLLDHHGQFDRDGTVRASDSDEEIRSARGWYLAGVGDGSILAEGERAVVRRMRDYLRSEEIWYVPAPYVRTELVGDAIGVIELSSPKIFESATEEVLERPPDPPLSSALIVNGQSLWQPDFGAMVSEFERGASAAEGEVLPVSVESFFSPEQAVVETGANPGWAKSVHQSVLRMAQGSSRSARGFVGRLKSVKIGLPKIELVGKPSYMMPSLLPVAVAAGVALGMLGLFLGYKALNSSDLPGNTAAETITGSSASLVVPLYTVIEPTGQPVANTIFRSAPHGASVKLVLENMPLLAKSDAYALWLRSGSGAIAPIGSFSFNDAQSELYFDTGLDIEQWSNQSLPAKILLTVESLDPVDGMHGPGPSVAQGELQ